MMRCSDTLHNGDYAITRPNWAKVPYPPRQGGVAIFFALPPPCVNTTPTSLPINISKLRLFRPSESVTYDFD